MTPPNRMILFVCTGNTCRSPMAQALAISLHAHRPHPGSATITFRSAGISTTDGLPASPEAIEAMHTRGIDLSDHLSTMLTPALVAQAHVIFTMTPSHSEAVIRQNPDAAHKVFPLDPTNPVPDPIGLPIEEYEHTAAHLEESIKQRLRELES